MPDIRLIAVDLDGTLLCSNADGGKYISENTLSVLRRAVQRGVYIAVASGRIYADVMQYSDQIAPGQPVICSNGAMALTQEPFDVVYCECLQKPKLRSVVEVLEKEKCYYQVYCDDGAVMESRHPNPHKARKNDVYNYSGDILNGDEMPKYVGDGALKVVCFIPDPAKLVRVRAAVEKLGGLEISSSWHDNIEILAKGVNKGEALRALAAHLEVPMECTMAFGDNENDLSMIEAAAIGVAMGNAEDMVKEKADHVTTANDEDGVARAVQKFVLGEE